VSDTACRYGGDEFVVLLLDLSDKDDALVVINDIRERLAAPYNVDGTAITVTASMGVAVYPIDARKYCDLIELADLAMYRQKSR
jgi:diguanylate cyclase (GGDEF)-like protein